MDFAVRRVETIPLRRPSKRSRRDPNDEHEPFDLESGEASTTPSEPTSADARSHSVALETPIAKPDDDEAGRRLDVTG